MEENLEPNNELNNQKTDKTPIPKSDEIKLSESEKVSNQEMVNINKNVTDLKNNLVFHSYLRASL